MSHRPRTPNPCPIREPTTSGSLLLGVLRLHSFRGRRGSPSRWLWVPPPTPAAPPPPPCDLHRLRVAARRFLVALHAPCPPAALFQPPHAMPTTATEVAVRRFSMTACGPQTGHRGPGGLRVLRPADLWLSAVRAPPSPPLVLTRSVVAVHRSALPAHCAPPHCSPRCRLWRRTVRRWLAMLHPPELPHSPAPAIHADCGVGEPVLCGSLCPPVAPPSPAWSAAAAHRPPPPSGCSPMADCGVWMYKIPRIPASFLLVKAAVLAQVTPPPAESHLASLPLPPSPPP